MASDDTLPDHVDVLVIGAGAAGLAAALSAHAAGADVAVIDKGEKLGGTAAISGGVVWAPNNPQMADAGLSDTREDALAYFQSLDHGEMDADVLAAFVDTAGEALGFLESQDAATLSLLPNYPDYYLDRPGAKPEGGRALDNELFDFRTLGPWAERVYNGGDIPRMLLRETPLGGGSGRVAPEEMERRVVEDQRGWGQALIGRLLKACLDRGVEPFLGATAKNLLVQNDKIVGAEVRRDDGVKSVRAHRGVVLATGGFEWNEDLKAAFLRGPLEAPASPPGNTGDGLKLAMAAGAGLGNMTSAWWMPTLSMAGAAWPENADAPAAPRATPVLIERTMPHSVMVNRAGRRFCNEANNYASLGGAFHMFDPEAYDYPNMPAWLIVDQQYRDRYPISAVMPGAPTPDWIATAETIEDLAATIGVDAPALSKSLADFNRHAEEGRDPEFGRGVSAYDRFYGDRSRPGAGATLGPVSQPPFYAVEIRLGALGTNGGPRTDAAARILDVEGSPIPGLFGAGNVISAPTGSVYAGAGGTLGPALTFGYLAGRSAARLQNR